MADHKIHYILEPFKKFCQTRKIRIISKSDNNLARTFSGSAD